MDENGIRMRMQQVVDLVTTDVSSIRTGKASSGLVSEMSVSVYGGQQRLKIEELGTISTPDAQTILINPWDKSVIGEIKKGIESANVGLNPNLDGDVIRIIIPPMTSEDREKYVKMLGVKIENGKVMIRQVRGDGMKDIKEAFEKKELSEDEKFSSEKKLQEITDEFTSKLNEIESKKTSDLLSM